MNQELPTIEQIKDKLKEWIRMAEEATPGPWKYGFNTVLTKKGNFDVASTNSSESIGHEDCQIIPEEEKQANATFIATSRTASPLAWKALLGAIEGLESCRSRLDDEDEAAFDAIQSIREQFKEVVL